MRVKKLISFYENQHYFTLLFVHNFLSRWLNESFRFFCVSHVKIQENGSFWFILQIPSFYSFLQLIGLPVSWRWHHLPVPPHHQLPQADNWWENQRWQIHLIQLPLNEQRGTTSLWSFPFVRYIHSDYITWLSKWLCMHIIPSFLVDKGFFLPLRLSCKESSTFSPSPSSSGSGDVTALRCSEPLRYKVDGASKPSPNCAGWDRLGITCYNLL